MAGVLPKHPTLKSAMAYQSPASQPSGENQD